MFLGKPLGLFMPAQRPPLIKGLLPGWQYADFYGSSDTPGSSHTFANVNIGQPAPNRYLVFSTLFTPTDSGAGTPLTMTVGGRTATLGAISNANVLSVAIHAIHFPYGNRCQVVASSTESLDVVGFAVLPLYGLTSATAHDSAASGALFQSSRSGTLDCPAGGVIIGGVFHSAESANTSWTNLTPELIDDSDSASVRWSTAGQFFTSAQTNRTVTASWGSGAICNLALASYPAVA